MQVTGQSAASFVYQFGRAGSIDCRNGAAYNQTGSFATGAVLEDPDGANGKFVFSALAIQADGKEQAIEDATVFEWTVDPMAPIVNAGADRTIGPTTRLAGLATDVRTGLKTVLWRSVSGPGVVSFSDAETPPVPR